MNVHTLLYLSTIAFDVSVCGLRLEDTILLLTSTRDCLQHRDLDLHTAYIARVTLIPRETLAALV